MTLIEEVEATDAGAQAMAAARMEISVSQALRAAHATSGMTHAELARKLDRGESFVAKVIEGEGNWPASTIARFLRAMGYQASLRIDPVEGGRPHVKHCLPANVSRDAPFLVQEPRRRPTEDG